MITLDYANQNTEKRKAPVIMRIIIVVLTVLFVFASARFMGNFIVKSDSAENAFVLMLSSGIIGLLFVVISIGLASFLYISGALIETGITGILGIAALALSGAPYTVTIIIGLMFVIVTVSMSVLTEHIKVTRFARMAIVAAMIAAGMAAYLVYVAFPMIGGIKNLQSTISSYVEKVSNMVFPAQFLEANKINSEYYSLISNEVILAIPGLIAEFAVISAWIAEKISKAACSIAKIDTERFVTKDKLTSVPVSFGVIYIVSLILGFIMALGTPGVPYAVVNCIACITLLPMAAVGFRVIRKRKLPIWIIIVTVLLSLFIIGIDFIFRILAFYGSVSLIMLHFMRKKFGKNGVSYILDGTVGKKRDGSYPDFQNYPFSNEGKDDENEPFGDDEQDDYPEDDDGTFDDDINGTHPGFAGTPDESEADSDDEYDESGDRENTDSNDDEDSEDGEPDNQ